LPSTRLCHPVEHPLSAATFLCTAHHTVHLLQALDLHGCKRVHDAPDQIRRLTSIRELNLSGPLYLVSTFVVRWVPACQTIFPGMLATISSDVTVLLTYCRMTLEESPVLTSKFKPTDICCSRINKPSLLPSNSRYPPFPSSFLSRDASCCTYCHSPAEPHVSAEARAWGAATLILLVSACSQK
jgi:hypothetical protein